MHGGLSPGAPRGPKNGNFKNGDWTADAIEERKWLRSLVQSFAHKHLVGSHKAARHVCLRREEFRVFRNFSPVFHVLTSTVQLQRQAHC
jgi:hypothetical protein